MRSVIATILSLATMAVAAVQEPSKATSRVKVIENHFIIPEAKASFTIPQQWLIRRNFRLDSTQLSTVQQDGTRAEWDSAYGPIIDAILPFPDCLLHIGSKAWGEGGLTGIQMRAYLTDAKSEQITKAVATKGVETAGKVKGRSVKSNSKDESGWRIDRLEFDLWYGDYGGRAGVDFYSRPCGEKTLVLVFMLDQERLIRDRDSIISSFRIKK